MVVILAGIEIDAHRDALDDFHEIAGGIFRRQQAEARSAGSADVYDAARVLLSIGVDAEFDPLARVHTAELRFLEIRGNPDVVQWDHRHQLLSGRHVFPELHGLLADDPGHRRDNSAIAEVELRLFYEGFPLL